MCIYVTVKIQFDNTSTSTSNHHILALCLVAMIDRAFRPPPIQKFWIRPCLCNNELLYIISFRYYAHCPSLHGLSCHNHMVLSYLMNYGSQEQIDTYIPRMVSGEFIGCIAMSEPAAGRYFPLCS